MENGIVAEPIRRWQLSQDAIILQPACASSGRDICLRRFRMSILGCRPSGSMYRHSDIIAWIACLPPDPQCQPLSLQHRLDPHHSAPSAQHRKILCHVSLKDCITQSTITLVFHGPCQFQASNLSTALQSRPHPRFILSVAFSSVLHLLFDELPQLMQNKIEKRSRNSSPIAFPWS